jgi:predicted DNA binding CopG/RHH family protein
MLPNNNLKFNKPKGKTKNFPIKQFRFDVTNSPIIKSNSKCSFKIKSLLSQQEELMLKGLSNSFQTDNTKAFRIALSKVSTIDSNELESSLPSSLAQTKLKGHTARNRRIELRIPKEEKEHLKDLATKEELTEQAAVRLVIIHTAKAIRAGKLTEIEGCKLLSQEECWDNWSKDKPVSSGKLDSLKQARDAGSLPPFRN